MHLRFPNSRLDLSTTRVMGVLNVTPDSFSDGGLYVLQEAAVERALIMLEEGADIIDVGGESTRPGAQPVTAHEEIDRVVGVIEALGRETDAPVSVDTSKPEVMRAAAKAGAAMLNDVRALTQEASIEVAAELGLPVCLMHMQGEPDHMQRAPTYGDVVTEVRDYLMQRVAACEQAGIAREAIVIDPGFGFGKTLEHNLALLEQLDVLVAGGYPVLVGMSRKSMIPALMATTQIGRSSAGGSHQATGRGSAGARERVGGSVTLALYAARKGAHIVRVHDIRETVEALTIQAALQSTRT